MEGLYNSCSEYKGVEQLLRNGKADLCICFRICQKSVSYDAAQLMSVVRHFASSWLFKFVKKKRHNLPINVENQARYM